MRGIFIFNSLFSLDPRHHEWLEKHKAKISPELFYALCTQSQKILIPKYNVYAVAYFELLMGLSDVYIPPLGDISITQDRILCYDTDIPSFRKEDFLCALIGVE